MQYNIRARVRVRVRFRKPPTLCALLARGGALRATRTDSNIIFPYFVRCTITEKREKKKRKVGLHWCCSQCSCCVLRLFASWPVHIMCSLLRSRGCALLHHAPSFFLSPRLQRTCRHDSHPESRWFPTPLKQHTCCPVEARPLTMELETASNDEEAAMGSNTAQISSLIYCKT